jgi:hypothetical protein
VKFFKDVTARSVHAVTALGNENYRFGPLRSQPRRGRGSEDRKRRAADEVAADMSRTRSAKLPDQGLRPDDTAGDIVRADKSWDFPLKIQKMDPDKQLIFGWASVVEKDGQLVVDKQGDIIPIEELESAAYEFNLNSRNGRDMHSGPNVAKLVESMVFTKDKQAAIGADIGQVGWWVGFKVENADLWAAHKRGERPEFSIGGAAIPIKVEVE